jgi:phosphomevalonate kinase
MTDGPYKEIYRAKMIAFGEQMRAADPGYWCKLTTANAKSNIWIIPDCRRKTDIEYFVQLASQNSGHPPIRVRVTASTATREARGFKFCEGIDDAESECGLDDYPAWDIVIDNEGDMDSLMTALENLIERILSTTEK